MQRRKAEHQAMRRFLSPAGLNVFGLMLAVSAAFSPGFSMTRAFFPGDLTVYFYPIQRTALDRKSVV